MTDVFDLPLLTKRIREKMNELGVNQAQLAKRAGITPAALSQILNQERTPSSGVLIKLAQALGESVDYLVGKTKKTELSELLQQKEVQILYRSFVGLSEKDKDSVMTMIKVLKQQGKKGK